MAPTSFVFSALFFALFWFMRRFFCYDNGNCLIVLFVQQGYFLAQPLLSRLSILHACTVGITFLCAAQVPYFLISHADMPMDGSTPTLLYGYGGFEISLPPVYSGVVGAGWLDTTSNTTSSTTSNTAADSGNAGDKAGGKKRYTCYVMANIRGGGEFGPAWHQAALRENRCALNSCILGFVSWVLSLALLFIASELLVLFSAVVLPRPITCSHTVYKQYTHT